ncbi:acyl-CoA desaturase [Marinilongibacter aquaticus]|uniref:fatty acid desaturase family protein n=1 Tax=Marinilongibacter aquaticus TaxID=2975157 RepID=UPI0021BD39E8|nr:acyl-CoA desaturase [Marinilongibacter aquaticus]UBM60025.1 acyl-CoA desaturase [Marinilongibacter aquaticus]
MKKIAFAKLSSEGFAVTLRNRVTSFLKETGKSRFGGNALVYKTIVMFLLFFTPLVLLMSGIIVNSGLLFGLYLISGLGMAGLGMCVMHDALHGSYARNSKVNRIVGYTLNLIGGNDQVWKLQHNVLHHSYTNIEDHDDDINAPHLLRFSPNSELRPIHRYQHLYAWFLYGLSTIFSLTVKDFIKIKRYYGYGLIRDKKTYGGKVLNIIFWKLIYLSYSLMLPLILAPFSPWLICLAFLSMHFIASLTLTVIFQTAHVIPKSQFPVPDNANALETDKWIHQLTTTCNFAPGNRTMIWLTGGLNHQIEHHLFPHISHVHYREISKIVRETAKEFGVIYNYYPTLLSAIRGHYQMLWILGRPGLGLAPVPA